MDIAYIIVIILIGLGFTYAISSANISLGLTTGIVRIDEKAYGNTEFDASNLDLVPILDSEVEKNEENVIKIDFTVGGASTNNNDNIIYDIALKDLEVNCDLLSPYVKWKLVKNGTKLSEGSLDYKFDTIDDNGRFLLTTIQQDLPKYDENETGYDNYNFYMWISDSCQDSDISNCTNVTDQSNLMKKTLDGKIEVELYTESKKELTRNPSSSAASSGCSNRYAVNYNLNGGTVSTSEKKYVISGSAFGELPTPTKTSTVTFDTDGGNNITNIKNDSSTSKNKIKLLADTSNKKTINYNFLGWYLEKNYTTKVDATTIVKTNENINLYAKWEDTKITLPITSKTGYDFLGWYSDYKLLNLVGKAEDSYEVINNITLYAKWQGKKYVLTYESNGGSICSPNTKTVIYGEKYGELCVPTKEDYTFAGWYTSLEGGVLVDENTVTEGDATVYARWSAIKSTVTLNNQGATNAGSTSVTATYGSAMPPITKPTRAYKVTYNYNGNGQNSSSTTVTYTFGGYYTETEEGGTQYYYTKDGTSARNWDKTVNTTLYASWTSASVTLPTPTRTGYTFSGWYTAATGGTEIGAGGASYTPTSNITIYARWSAIKSTVTLNNQGATNAGSTSVTATYGSAMPPITKPTRAYKVTYNYNGNGQNSSSTTVTYTFGGYYTETEEGGTQYYYTKDGTSARNWDKTVNTTLYASWTSASVTLPTPIKKGSIFSGWYTAATGGTKIGDGGVRYTPTKNITLYAQWKKANWAISSPATGANDLATAISLAKKDATLTLQKSYTDKTSGKVSKNLNFDFGTYTLTRNSHIYLTDEANVTFNGDNDTGGVTNTAASCTIFAYSTTSVAEFKGGVYQNKSNTPVFCNLGQSIITDGIFISADANTIQNGTSESGGNKGLLWISGGSFIANGSTGGSAVIRNFSDDHWPVTSDPNNYERYCDHSCSVHINGGSFDGNGDNKNGVYQNTTDGKGLVHFPWHSTSSVNSLSKYSLAAGNGSILANGGSFHAKITNYLKSSSGVTFGKEALCSYSTFPSVKCSELLDK